jgi:hypothetical protein
MTRRWRIPLVIVAVAVAVAAGSASRAQDPGDGNGSVGGGPPPAPPRADPAAGRPAYLAAFEDERMMILDAKGRVVRLLPRSAYASGEPCPGGSRLVDGADWAGAIHVRRLDGTLLWQRRIPIAYVSNLECLDPLGRRVGVVTESESRPVRTLRIVSRRGSRVVMRTGTQTPMLTRRRFYVSDPRGVKSYAVPSGRLVHELAGPAGPHQVLPSPNGRWLALTHLTEGLRDRSFLADVRTGEVRPIPIPRLTLLGWVEKQRLAVRSDRRLRILDTALRERLEVAGFRPLSALITHRGDVVAVHGNALVSIRRGADRVEQIGSVPDGTWLHESLR